MIYRSKIYFDKRTKYNSPNMPMPFYAQSVAYWLGRVSTSNSQIFDIDYCICNIVLCNINFAKEHILNGKRVICYCTSIHDFNNQREDIDKEKVFIIDLCDCCNIFLKDARIIKVNPEYSMDDVIHIFPELKQRVLMPNITAFVRDEKDITNIIRIWKQYVRGNLYIFKRTGDRIDFNIISKIEEENNKQEGRYVKLFNFDKDLETVINALTSSVISVFYYRELVYQYWSIFIRCFPIVFKDDIINSRMFYLENEVSVDIVIRSLLDNKDIFQEMISSFEAFRFNHFDLNQFIPMEVFS